MATQGPMSMAKKNVTDGMLGRPDDFSEGLLICKADSVYAGEMKIKWRMVHEEKNGTARMFLNLLLQPFLT